MRIHPLTGTTFWAWSKRLRLQKSRANALYKKLKLGLVKVEKTSKSKLD